MTSVKDRMDMKTNQATLRDQLEEDILEGRYTPGEYLEAGMLATRYGVSRTPVREVLSQLMAIGLVTTQPSGRGFAVEKPGPQLLVEMFDVMAELEGMVGRLAARRCRPEDHDAILAAHEQCKKAMKSGDPDAYYYENERFHAALYSASGSKFLNQEASALHKRLRPYRRLQLRAGNRMSESFQEHENIVNAIFSGRSDEAQKLLRSHVAIQGERFADFLSSLSMIGEA